MRKIMIALLIALSISTLGCTANMRARHWGGTSTINLPPGKKLVTATWKEGNDLWYLVRDAKPGETPEKLQFIESSSMGVMQGSVVFVEH